MFLSNLSIKQPVLATILAILFLGEHVSGHLLVGGTLVLVGVALLGWFFLHQGHWVLTGMAWGVGPAIELAYPVLDVLLLLMWVGREAPSGGWPPRAIVAGLFLASVGILAGGVLPAQMLLFVIANAVVMNSQPFIKHFSKTAAKATPAQRRRWLRPELRSHRRKVITASIGR